MPRKLVFIGPSLSATERPDAKVEYLGPVRHGSLFSLPLGPGDIVLIVDGVYQHFAPLRHKEIMAHLAMGVRIFGAASFGALRAAELRDVGAIPLGKVARAYCDGTVSDDSEVAVLHSPYDHHSRLTVPLVSVRFAVADLLERRRLDADAAQGIICLLSDVHFTLRSLDVMRQILDRAGFAPQAELLLQELRGKPDVKAEDARQAILHIDRLEECAEADCPDIRWQTSFAKTSEFETRRVRAGFPLTHCQLSAFAQLLDADYPQYHRNYVASVVSRSSAAGFTSAEDVLRRAGYCRATLDNSPFGSPTEATRSWSVAERVLVRTFRLAPGTQARVTLPDASWGADGGAFLVATLSRHLSRTGFAPARAAEWKAALMALYECHSDGEFALCCMERGLLNVKTALRLACQFDVSLASECDAARLLAHVHA
ncbi:TfuA-like protein [Bradyrhizobium pachyrhizi]|uniref:TfuA-like protein n=1 Tax=Bradyrhizobium pachyrhizi TaxID=280333 RepID=UPI0024B21327|nr:TfuA-like protein [Bradyrhizobium pachyrhizi]WFU53624.1 TfuA-like protein [Bradyrhizobium pachyrhizi]